MGDFELNVFPAVIYFTFTRAGIHLFIPNMTDKRWKDPALDDMPSTEGGLSYSYSLH
jgi:hypothetical protein